MSFFYFQPKEWDDDPKLTIDFRGFNPSKMGPRRPARAEDASFSTPTG